MQNWGGETPEEAPLARHPALARAAMTPDSIAGRFGGWRLHASPRLVCLARKLCYNARMNKPQKIIKVGNSAGLILPKDVLARLHLEQGDSVDFVENGSGGLELRRHEGDSEFAAQMAAAREVMAHRKRALRELAK